MTTSERIKTVGATQYVNYSAEEFYTLQNWLPRDLAAEKVVFFPDACPGQAPLPTGCAVKIPAGKEWMKYSLSDTGCGMLLLESKLRYFDDAGDAQFDRAKWDEVGLRMKENRGKLGDLGGGNHFLDAIVDYESGNLSFLIHTGSRTESGLLDDLVGDERRFKAEYARVTDWARQNRAAIGRIVQDVFGECEQILDLAHNSFETLADGSTIIRKGVVRAAEGSLTVLPSSMNGDVSLLRMRAAVDGALNSISHGTGRTMSRSEAKKASESYDFAALRKGIYIPDYIQDIALRTEGPHCYRGLDACLALVGDLAEEVKRYTVVAYLGGL